MNQEFRAAADMAVGTFRPLLAESLKLLPATELEKLDKLLAAGGRVGLSVMFDGMQKVHVDVVGAELEGRRILFGTLT